MSDLVLEELVSSKIRLHLLTYLLTHPEERVYLRGLAKTLEAPVTPVRRELQRLMAMGLLKTIEEGALKYYWVDRASPEFPRLLGLIQQHRDAPPVAAPQPPVAPAAAAAVVAPQPVMTAPARGGWWRWGFGLSSVAFIITLLLLVYVLRTNTSLMDIAERAMSRTFAAARQLPGPPTLGGELESPRWRVVPGSLGGFAPATAGPASVKETY